MMDRFGATSIIIPSHNGLPLLKLAIDSINRYTDVHRTPYEIIVVDNGSEDRTCEWCEEQRIRFVSYSRQTGYPLACNAGMRVASGDYMMLLNNDVIATENWLLNLLLALTGHNSTGMVGPVTNYASGKQMVEYTFQTVDEFQRIARGVNRSNPKRWEETNRLIGMCMLFKRHVYEAVGELDLRFSPGHYEDDDYCMRIRQAGYKLLICHDALVYHEGSASFTRIGADRLQELVNRNRQLYIDKWKTSPE
jgi:GT2 family glycosyltransferase